MRARGVAAVIVPSTDPHQSEYVDGHWEARQWLSGFTGSAGTLVVTASQAGLWTDGRYFTQAEQELAGSGIRLFRAREPGVPGVNEWVAGQVKPGGCIAVDGRLVSMTSVREMKRAFAAGRIRLRTDWDPVGALWHDRPPLSRAAAIGISVRLAGEPCRRKLAAVHDFLVSKKADALLLASLDDIAWLLNIRGGDSAYSPVIRSYALVTRRRAIWFVDGTQVPRSLARRLASDGVVCRPYEGVAATLAGLRGIGSVVLNPMRVNQRVREALPRAWRIAEESPDVTTTLKAVKNPVEQEGFRRAARSDGAALVRFMAWLDRTLEAGQSVTEYSAGVRLSAFRAELSGYRGDSFRPICAYGPNAAMIHYSAREARSSVLRRRGFLLVDSGGHYHGATMDTTRTMALGAVDREMRRHYTLVLKGLIALSRMRFPAGTTGTHLDAVARIPLWSYRSDYRHGTGHGVGAYLNVHEGPQGFVRAWQDVPLKAGMVITIEPGFYEENGYGIRIENMLLVAGDGSTPYGEFLRFETLTVCPVDTAPLMPELLDPSERAWLNDYHRRVRRTLRPLLAPSERAWLLRRTRPV